jgi:hypothetical protein
MGRTRTETKVGDVRFNIERRDGKWGGHLSVVTLDEAGSPFNIENRSLADALQTITAAERTALDGVLKKMVRAIIAGLGVGDIE